MENISFKRGGFIKFKIPESWEVEAKSYGFLLLGGFEESFSYKIVLE